VDHLLEQDLGTRGRAWHDDPMLHEFLHGQAIAAPTLNFGPDDGEEDSGSPAYVPVSGLRDPSTRGQLWRSGLEEIALQAGVQLPPPPKQT
jgi:hypothetical protein